MKRVIFYTTLFGLAMSIVATAFFARKVAERNRFVDDLIETTLGAHDVRSTDDAVLALSEEIYRRTRYRLQRNDLDWYSAVESTSPFNVTSGVSLKYSGFGIEEHYVDGPCGTMTRTLLNALWRLDIPARKLQLLDNEEGRGGGHTMVEYASSGRWHVIAPSDSSFVWRKDDGGIATVAEIQDDFEMFSSVYSRYQTYPYLFDNPAYIRWGKLPARLRGALRFVLGKERYEQLQTPRLYDTPRTLFLLLSLVATAVFALAAVILSPRRSTAV